MGPDPQFLPVIEGLKAMPSLADLPLDVVRNSPMLPNDNPIPVDEVSNRTIPGPAGEIPVRIYRSGTGTLPLVVFFHGGGFVVGNPDTHDNLSRLIVSTMRCLMVSVDYRLAPEHPFPAAQDDCFAALKWAAANAAELGADATKIFVCGDSAGGNLAAVASLRARDEGGPKLKGQVLIYPVTDFTAPFGPGPDGNYYILTAKDRDFFDRSYVPEAAMRTNPLASPAYAKSLAGLPPALVVTAEHDPLCPQGELYAEKLKQAGVETTLSSYKGAIHGFLSFPTPMGEESARACAQWMRTHA